MLGLKEGAGDWDERGGGEIQSVAMKDRKLLILKMVQCGEKSALRPTLRWDTQDGEGFRESEAKKNDGCLALWRNLFIV